MTPTALAPRAHDLLARLDSWAHEGRVRSLLVKALVTVLGPVVVVVGVAMTVLPGPGLVVIALGLAMLAAEYDWARRTLRWMGHKLSRAREAALPKDGSRSRRALGGTVVATLAAASFVLTTAVTTFLGASALL